MRIKLMILIIILMFTITFGCIFSDEKSDYKPDISISNMANKSLNATVIISSNNNEIYNNSILLESQSYSIELIRIKVPGKYHIQVVTDNNLTFDQVKDFSDAVTRVAITIYDDKIEINMKVS